MAASCRHFLLFSRPIYLCFYAQRYIVMSKKTLSERTTAMNTIKLDTSKTRPVVFAQTSIPVEIKVTIDGFYDDVRGRYDLITGEFTTELIGVYGVQQFADIQATTVEEINKHLSKQVKKTLKAL